MELQPNLIINRDSFEVAIVGQDNHVTVIHNREKITTHEFGHVQGFIRDEMVCPIEYDRPMDYEIRDQLNNIVLPFKLKAQVLWLCPFFFGKKWSLWSGGKLIVDLNVALYLGLREYNPTIH